VRRPFGIRLTSSIPAVCRPLSAAAAGGPGRVRAAGPSIMRHDQDARYTIAVARLLSARST